MVSDGFRLEGLWGGRNERARILSTVLYYFPIRTGAVKASVFHKIIVIFYIYIQSAKISTAEIAESLQGCIGHSALLDTRIRQVVSTILNYSSRSSVVHENRSEAGHLYD